MSNMLNIDLWISRPDGEGITKDEARMIVEDIELYLSNKGYSGSVFQYDLIDTKPIDFIEDL